MVDLKFSTPKLVRGLLFLLAVSAAYLYPFPQANFVYPAVVVVHTLGGIVATVAGAWVLVRLLRQGSWAWKSGWLLLGAGAVLGLVLVWTGTARSEFRWLYAHIIFCMAGVGCLMAEWLGRRARSFAQNANEWGRLGFLSSHAMVRLLACFAALGLLGWAAHYQRENRWLRSSEISNPAMPPAGMDGEGDGPTGPFFPSSAQVYGGQKIPSNFFMESDSCRSTARTS